jgi:hypothetical protein
MKKNLKYYALKIKKFYQPKIELEPLSWFSSSCPNVTLVILPVYMEREKYSSTDLIANSK